MYLHAGVSAAFSCLSDPDKRATYERYGSEDPQGAMRGAQGGGGPGMHPWGPQEAFDPEEIFNMFFNGGFPGHPRCAYYVPLDPCRPLRVA